MSVLGTLRITVRHYRVTDTVTQVNTCISKSNTSERRSQTTRRKVKRGLPRKEKKLTASASWPRDHLGFWRPGGGISRKFAKPTSRIRRPLGYCLGKRASKLG